EIIHLVVQKKAQPIAVEFGTITAVQGGGGRNGISLFVDDGIMGGLVTLDDLDLTMAHIPGAAGPVKAEIGHALPEVGFLQEPFQGNVHKIWIAQKMVPVR